MRIFDFFKNWGTLMVAALALIQPWALYLFKKVFKGQIIEAYGAGGMEIGFSDFGPPIGLQGTIRSLNQDAFIHNITLKIVRERDRSEHIFQWGLFRSPAIASFQQTPMEICSSFLLTERSPRRLNILFLEQSAANKIRPKLDDLRRAWINKIHETPGGMHREQASITITSTQNVLDDLAHKFSKERIYVDTYSYLDRNFYWEAGGYGADISINTARPSKNHPFKWRFEITQSESDLLRLNIINILMQICDRPIRNYNFIFPAYIPIK